MALRVGFVDDLGVLYQIFGRRIWPNGLGGVQVFNCIENGRHDFYNHARKFIETLM